MLCCEPAVANHLPRARTAARASAAAALLRRHSEVEVGLGRPDPTRSVDRSISAQAWTASDLAEQSLYQMLLDEGESVNRLYRIVSQAGCDILFYGEAGDLIGRYGRPRPERGRSNGRSCAGDDGASASHGGLLIGGPPVSAKPARNARVSPFASPVYDADGRLVGSLGISRCDGGRAEMPAMIQTLVHTTAHALEERAFRTRYAREWILALVPRDARAHGILLAVDRNQRVVGADRHARTTLLQNERDVLPIALWSLFEKNATIFRYAHVGDMPAVLTALGTAKVWSALVTPPASERPRTLAYGDAYARPRLDLVGCLRPPAAIAASRGGLAPRALQRVREFIEGHLAENIGLQALAQAAGLSRCHFVRAFKQSVGTTPHAYLMQRRLARAEALLVETDYPLCRVALDSGFSDQSHFSSYFRRNFGVSPRSFRRSRR